MEAIKKILRTPSAFVLFLVAIISLIGVIIKSETDKAIARMPIDATSTAAKLTALANTSTIPSLTSSPTLSLADLELTVNAMKTQVAIEAGATATQQYIYVLQTVQAEATAMALRSQIETEQVYNSEATAQSIISGQQTATAIANNQSIEKVLSFTNQLPSLPLSFLDTFEDNRNGWSPKNADDYSVSLRGDVLTVNFSNPEFSPFMWTCDNCGPYKNFSYQIDIKTPNGIPRVVSGILFGSPTRLDQQPFQESYALSIYSSGAVLLERLSADLRDTVELWDHRQDLITPDGEFHTLQVVVVDKFVAVYIDGKLVGDVVELEYSTAGYIGIVSQTTDVDVIFDNLKVVLLP